MSAGSVVSRKEGGGTSLDPETVLWINQTNTGIIFTTKGPLEQIDLVAATRLAWILLESF